MAGEAPDDGIVSGLQADVSQHLASKSAEAPEADDGLVSGLKADVDAHLAGKSAGQTDVAAKKTHAPVDLSKMTRAQKINYRESNGVADAKNPNSTATGVGQFERDTWLPTIKKHRPDLAQGKSDDQLLAMRNDPQLSEQMTEAHAQDNEPLLKAAGVPVNDASIYGAHWFGAGDKGMAGIYHADPKTPIENIIGKHAADINRLSGKTTDDVKTLLAQRMGSDYMPQPQDWGDVASQAASNLLPSTGHLLAGVASSVMHPIDTMTTLWQIGSGLASKVNGWAGHPQNPEKKAKDEALVDALGRSYKEKYGTLDGFKQYLAHDPAGVLMDASTVLTGGGGAAAKLPGIAGKAGEIAGTVGKMVNPLNPLGAVSGTVKAATAPAAVLDQAGNVVPKVDALIKKVTKGTMSGADLVDPQAKAAFAESLGKKGVSDATVREALLKSLGLKAPTHIVTGEVPPTSAMPEVNKAIGENNEALAAHAAKISPPASTSRLGEGLDNTHASSMNAASAAYDKIRTMPGSFGPTMPGINKLGQRIRGNLDKSGIPTGDMTAVKASGHPQTYQALKLLNDYWVSGRTLAGKGVDANEILAMRKSLNNLRSSAQGSDIKGVGDVIDGFDGHVSDMASRGLFKSAAGQPLPDIGKQIKSANAQYRDHFNTYETPNKANNSVVNAVKTLKAGQTRTPGGMAMPSGDEDLYTKAQGSLSKELLHPTKGPDTYNRLTKALGSSAPVDEHIKSLLMNPETKNASAMLNSPIAQKAFASAPDDLSRARHIQAASDLNNSKIPLESKISRSLGETMKRGMWKGAAGIAGDHFGGLPGAMVGSTMIEPIAEHMAAKRAVSQAMSGAPHTSGLTARTLKKTARRLTNPTALATSHYIHEAQQAPGIARASGGKVDEEALVKRLVTRWKQAKRATDDTTKPLLGVHDNVIAKALDVAQRNI